MRFLDVSERFWKFQEVSQSCNMLRLGVERCGRVSPVSRCVLTIISVKAPMKRNFLFFHMKEHKKLERLPFTDP